MEATARGNRKVCKASLKVLTHAGKRPILSPLSAECRYRHAIPKTVHCCSVAGTTLLFASTIRIDFENFSDGELIGNQIPGFTFANAVIFKAGFSLNEIDLPTHPGVNVASDNGGPLSIAFATSLLAACFRWLTRA